MMKRGEIWWVNFGTTAGGEIQKTRPAVVVSNNASNKYLNRIQVLPLTSNVRHLYPSEAYVDVAGTATKAMADQVTTASKTRLLNKIGDVSFSEMEAIEAAIRIQLGLK